MSSDEVARRLKSRRTELGLTQEEAARRTDLTARWYGALERGARVPRRPKVVADLAAFLGLAPADLETLIPPEELPKGRRTPPSQTLWQLPALANSTFWSGVLHAALAYGSDVATPRGLRSQAQRAQPPSLVITPMVHEDSHERWRSFLRYAHRYASQLALCAIAPPCNLPRGDIALIARLRDDVHTLVKRGVYIICLDRRFPWQNKELLAGASLPPIGELDAIPFIGNQDAAMGEAAAKYLITEFEREGITEPRISIITDDQRFTTSQDRVAGIKKGLGTHYKNDLFDECRFDRGSPSPGDENSWGMKEAADAILTARPHGIITITSTQAKVVTKMWASIPRSWPRPAICALDGESAEELGGVSYATYTAAKLATKTLDCLDLLRKGQRVSREWCALDVGITNLSAIQQAARAWAEYEQRRR